MLDFKPKSIARLASVQLCYINLQCEHEANMSDIEDYYTDIECFKWLYEIDEDEKVKLKFDEKRFHKMQQSINDVAIDELMDQGGIRLNSSPLLLSVIRNAICELIFFEEEPYKVVINEFTNIASSMLSQEEVAFINFFLDNIAKKLGKKV
jgi:transcription termination factor NusB